MAKKIILVHGLGGSNSGTWGNFPKFIRDDSDIDFEVVQAGYTTPMPDILKPKTYLRFIQRTAGILTIANGVLTEIRNRCDLANDEIILVGHSLGGIIIKKILLILYYNKTQHKISKVCFVDVPHDGSSLASVGKFLLPLNQHLKSLTRDSDELHDLNIQWEASKLGDRLSIMSMVAEIDDVVSPSSSTSNFLNHPVETILGTNHTTIVKPETPDSLAFIVLKNFILAKRTITKYKNGASRNFEDWKRVERNHRYQYVTDDNRTKNHEGLKDALTKNGLVIRLTGASGLGKTRLLLNILEAEKIVEESDILVFEAPGYERDIRDSVRLMVSDNACGLILIENCNIDLHNELVKEFKNKDCVLKVVTIGYSDEQVDDSIHIKLSRLSDEAIKQVLTPILKGMASEDIERVAKFAQGYPLMATLIAEQYQKEGKLLGSIETDSIVKKLIDGDGGVTDQEKGILSAISLFDVFGLTIGQAGEEAKFIAEKVASSNLTTFHQVIKKFTQRQIINQAGRYARLVPKPLALTLASDWWETGTYEQHKELIDNLPDSLMNSFCIQATYLDKQPNVQRFSERLFGGASPFVQAEELLTERGSRLFRAFVEVNPESTSNALFHILTKFEHERLISIDGDIRRNLVIALEKLCFREKVFEKSAWSLLLLASAENESWNNNATELFSQLFRVRLSGTQALPEVRFALLQKAIEADQESYDMVVLEALSESISLSGGSRTLGAEYQGTGVSLEEWHPKIWQEVFDFWQQAFDLMLSLGERGEPQKEKVLSVIGHSIRGFASRGRIEMLDKAIRKVIALNGRYWPSALESIKNAIEFDSKGMTKETENALQNWLKLLSPDDADLPEKLKIVVANPPWEHRKDDEGHYVDLSAQNAETLAIEVSKDIQKLIPLLPNLLIWEQKQGYAFGRRLALEVDDANSLVNNALEAIKLVEHPDDRLIQGLLSGIFERSPELWEVKIDQLCSNEKLVLLYPTFVRTGKISEKHLNTMLGLITEGKLSPKALNILSYGRALDGLAPEKIASFCLELAAHGEQGSWAALRIIYMYCFSDMSPIEVLHDELKKIVVSVPLSKSQDRSVADSHHWQDLASKLLNTHDQEFAVALIKQIVSSSKNGFDYGDVWGNITPVLSKLMEQYGEVLWPVYGDAVLNANGIERYWLQKILERDGGGVRSRPGVLSALPIETIIDWCRANPEVGPIFIARCLDVFEDTGDQKKPSLLFIAMLKNFGHVSSVCDELSSNTGTRSWSGSLIPYLESDKKALEPLTSDQSLFVAKWAKEHIAYIDKRIAYESERDEELSLGFY